MEGPGGPDIPRLAGGKRPVVGPGYNGGSDAATSAGVVGVLREFRGCRSCLAQPPANRWHPSGMEDGGSSCR